MVPIDYKENGMKRVCSIGLAALTLLLTTPVIAQSRAPEVTEKPLILTGAIPLQNVQGRIDHFGFDPKGQLFISALGNNTEEVIDIGAGRAVHSIGRVPKPQGVAYSPELNKLFVGSDGGK